MSGRHWHAKPQTVQGVRYRSGFEAEIARCLHAAGVEFGYETESFFYEVPREYTPDFVLTKKDGTKIHVEVKGRFTVDDRRKLLEVKRANPSLDLRLLFQRGGTRLTKAARSQTYGQWATKQKIPWAEKQLPAAWTAE